MSWLGLALFAEGPTDHRFLAPLLARATQDLCVRRARSLVEVAPVRSLHSPRGARDQPRAERIRAAAERDRGAFHILFVHADGAGDPAGARLHQVEPARRLVRDALGATHETVPVVPVREMEAWALADGAALRAAFGTTLDDEQLGIPGRAAAVEQVSDPKKALDEVFARARGDRRTGHRGAAAFLDILGQTVRIETLRRVPAFATFESDLARALVALGVIAGADEAG